MPGIARIDANDLDPSVVESMKRNIQFNGPQVQGLVHAVCSDARMIMMQSEKVRRSWRGEARLKVASVL